MGATVVLHAAFILIPLLVEELLHGDARTAGLGAARDLGGGRHRGAGGRPAAPIVTPATPGRRGLTVSDRRLALWWFAADMVRGDRALLLGIVGLGLGLGGSPRQAAAMDAVTADRVGMAAGTYYTGRYLGGVIGSEPRRRGARGDRHRRRVTLGFGLLALVGVAIVGSRSAPRPADQAGGHCGVGIRATRSWRLRSVVPNPASVFWRHEPPGSRRDGKCRRFGRCFCPHFRNPGSPALLSSIRSIWYING
jgi:hypothetical protein